MASVQERIDERKRRLEQLSRRNKIHDEVSSPENISNPISGLSSLDLSRIKASNVEEGQDQKKQDLQNSQEPYDDSSYDGTENMRKALKDSLTELQRRTDEAIKRVVRQRIISDALNEK